MNGMSRILLTPITLYTSVLPTQPILRLERTPRSKYDSMNLILLIVSEILIRYLPERSRARWTMGIKVLIEPGTNHTSLRSHSADLNAITTPSFLSAVTRQ
ncbi:hypothetical protein B5807_09831 [Epicoccum nigrum]|uniref:Uncharacterized protein n=1 Tax=Epicoccum nigrum TaxID=105696 RepID=A0A1Y2LT65_EPING|nr:hypothetical protein B5807_09831 [Epicoccum nigrum]